MDTQLLKQTKTYSTLPQKDIQWFKNLKENVGGGGQSYDITRGSVDWACVAHLSFCFEET